MSLYLTAILPPAQLSEEIDDIRKDISNRFHIYAALKPPVHITLFRPVNMDTSMEKYLIKWLSPVAHLHDPFNQELLNFDSFNNKTLFVNCVNNPDLKALQKNVSTVFNLNKIDPKEQKSNTRFHPHITIAYRDVTPEIFVPLWDELKNRKFKRSFRVDRFSLLKHDGLKWNVFEEFLLRKPAETLSLF